ncbi:MAG TPA: hypothetical protein VJ716_03580 [Gaiellaceae bacterium]|nr:hypothetical protein [Gaiellaceae bacterium]
MRTLALLLLVALVLAGCGGSSKGKIVVSTTSTVQDPTVEKEQITTAYEKFFSGSTSLSERVGVLQNGAQFRPVIKAFASNPLAKNVSVKVSSVTLQGADKAKVAYQVKFAGSSLPKQTGTAVRQGGKWKVGFASLCKLVSLGGSTPSACKS